jgi:TPP-dependent 2-oxoacid decarboxylase
MENLMESFVKNFGEEYCAQLPTLAESIVQILKFYGCNRIYGIGGDYVANLIKSIEKEIELLPSSNEMHAGFTACGQAEAEGLGVCLTTYTVGSLPSLAAAAIAKTERLPVIFISGAPGENEMTNSSLHHIVCSNDDWKINYNAALNAFSALGIRAERLQGPRSRNQPNIANEQFFNLITYAYEHKEPVFIEVPRDLPQSKVQAMTLPFSPSVAIQKPVILSGANLIAKEVARKLQLAKKPLVFFGEKIKFNRVLITEILEFCKNHNIPYSSNLFAKGILDESDPLCVGMYNGVFSQDPVRKYIETEVDYILEIGTSIFTQDTGTAFATGTHIIDDFTNKTTIKGTSPSCSDVQTVIEYLKKEKIPSFSFVPFKKEITQLNPNAPITFNNLTDTLNELQTSFSEAFIYLAEIGNSYFASFNLNTKASSIGRSWITNPWYAAMGTSLPYARAICHTLRAKHYKDIPVVITGDGGFHFQVNDLIQFQRDKLFVIIILMNNQIFHLGKNGTSEIYNSTAPEFDISMLAKAYGGKAYPCTSVAEFKTHFINCAKAKTGINILEVKASTKEEDLCKEIQLLNLYIKSRLGAPEDVAKWNSIKGYGNT